MKTEAIAAQAGTEHKVELPATELGSAPAQSASAFQTLLSRALQSGEQAAQPTAAIKAEGIAVGCLVHVNADGSGIQVQIPSLGLGPLAAASMVALGLQHVGQSLALGFEGANAQRPIVLGLMMQPQADGLAEAPDQPSTSPTSTAPVSTSSAIQVTRDGQRVVVEAHTELELRCGDAVILLSADGQIHIRGAYVTTHATASNRIRGGSVQIN